jgi:integrase
MSCPDRHARDDDRLGEPLCPDCYDYTGSVLFNSCAPELWRRFTITLRRALARTLAWGREHDTRPVTTSEELTDTGSAAVIAGNRIEGTTKNGRSRTVSLDAETVQVLRDRWKRQTQDRLKAGPQWKGTDDYVFRTAWGEPIHPDTVSSLMATLIKAHNDKHPDSAPPHARPHDLRHVHATTLLLAGAQVHVVAARLGHADPSITLRVDAHVISNQLAEAADVFARLIKAAG